MGCASHVRPQNDQAAVEGTKEAERFLWSFKGGTQDVQTSPGTLSMIAVKF